MNILEDQEQRFLDLIWRFLDERVDHNDFYQQFLTRWSDVREHLWQVTVMRPCPDTSHRPDFRPLLRFLDAIEAALPKKCQPAELRESIRDLTASYYKLKREKCIEHSLFLQPRPINVFEHPCSPARLYPCTVAEIRRQLDSLPEQDLVGLWAVGLVNPRCYEQNAYGIYYRSRWRTHGPIILILSQPRATEVGREEDLRRFILDNVLPHEVGHHVQYEQRSRNGYKRALPTATKEQFAEDYALRMARRCNVARRRQYRWKDDWLQSDQEVDPQRETE